MIRLTWSTSFLAVSLLGLPFVCGGQIIRPLSAESGSARLSIEMRARPDAIQLQGLEWVIPELIIGGEWTSTIRLTNRGTKSIPTTNVFFVDNTGNPMQAAFRATDGSAVTGAGFSFSLGIGGLVEATFLGGASAAFGHAVIGCSVNGCGTPGLYGEVTLTNTNSTRPDFQSVFPLEEPFSLQYMLFDGRNGITTTLYLVNESTTPSGAAIDVFDTGNNLLGTANLVFGALSSQILTLHVLAPETIGIQGTLVIRSQSGGALITATALQINPTNSFTPLRAFVPAP
jgi:hypothetical protein